MLDKTPIWKLTRAWELAWQTRFCPPTELILGSQAGPEALAHRQACPCCHELATSPEEQGTWPRLAAALASPPAQSPAPAVAPGQLWSLAPRLDGWGPKHRYYNAPLVLVLKVGLHLENGVLVAQTYHDPLLRGDDDVPLGPERFAQPWNVYTLHRDNLAVNRGQFGPEVAGRVLAAGQSPPQHLDQWSTLYLFRQMEIELGCFFSSAAVCALLEEYQALAAGQERRQATPAQGEVPAEAGPPMEGPGQPGDPVQLCNDLLSLGLEFPEGQVGVAAADLYFQAMPPRGELPLVAAGAGPGWEVPVVALDLREGRPLSWRLLEALVTDYVAAPQVTVGGRLCTPLPPGEHWQAEFRWLDDNGQLVSSQANFLAAPDGGPARFWAVFPLEDVRNPPLGGRLRIRLFNKMG